VTPEDPSGGTPTISGPFSNGDPDKGDPKGPDMTGGTVQTPAPEVPDTSSDGDTDTRVLSNETKLERLGRYAVQAVQRFAFPLILALAVIAFLAVQHWLDRKTPKLAYAPVHSKYDQVGFE